MDISVNTIKWPDSIIICEVGPRDGLQNEHVLLDVEQKVALIERSVQAGAKIIEIGSFVHPKAVPQMSDTDEIAKKIRRINGVEYRTLVMNLRGLERAEAAGIKKAKLTASASSAHSQANINKTPEEVIHGFNDCANFAAKHGIELSGAISAAFGYPVEGQIPLEQVLSMISCFREIGVKELSLSDTTGMANPRQVYEYSLKVQSCFPDITWVLHFHNTRGMGLANVLAGMMAGIDRYDASFAGLGGCPFAPGASGNISTEDLIHMCQEMDVRTGYDLDEALAVGRYVREMVGHDTDSFILKAGKCSEIKI